MSSWVDSQRQKAFKLWKVHLALGLHFSESLSGSYDFNKYNGGTKASYENFLKKPLAEVGDFIRLANKLEMRDIDPCEFIFANILSDHSTYIKSLNTEKAFDNYYVWKPKKGDPESFNRHVNGLIGNANIRIWHGDDTLARYAVDALLNKNLWDIVVYMISKNPPDLAEQMKEKTADNAMMRIYLDIVSKNQRIYRHLGIV